MNQKLAGKDLSELYDRIWRAVPIPSVPNLRKIDQVLPTMPELGQSLRKGYSDSDLLKVFKNDKYLLPDIWSQQVKGTLIEQDICKKRQLQCKGNLQLQHIVQADLSTEHWHAYVRLLGMCECVYKLIWTAEREKQVWRLELDLGKVGIKMRPATARSLTGIGPIDTEFELPESRGCAAIVHIDCQAQDVDDEWQLLEAY